MCVHYVQEFEKQSEIMDMKEEMMSDSIDEAMAADDDEEERSDQRTCTTPLITLLTYYWKQMHDNLHAITRILSIFQVTNCT